MHSFKQNIKSTEGYLFESSFCLLNLPTEMKDTDISEWEHTIFKKCSYPPHMVSSPRTSQIAYSPLCTPQPCISYTCQYKETTAMTRHGALHISTGSCSLAG
jgi:hypothetical protein